ncbi:recombinase RecF [Leifsonia xyli subsp. xyli]|uniref:DNA replication and repair protein RecF n=2 Tax=Leifsonia xyli subsp. xyli TaxID=59736 RepID=RECF_LEIXX|nr:DNA replication/repair protein RecF [Leifsonia xyli]Q6AHN3.1 RecName: Full=DNA replication and repair protein RecF [Leifsonia xyli subsp. xyli str. CTCB07]AAT88112.1 DNA replication and repair protein RecF [Leifsonia xyli subsp. xyli str. CTCB07]ODA89343.1 recombinase RecF [Leifsonia xyli subsp. xyli]
MRVTHLSLTDFRNYGTAEVHFEAGANLFVGRNGQGKTNLVESLGYLSALGSHRVSSDQAMIRQGAELAVVRARIQHEARELLVEVQLNRGAANRAQVNRAAIKPRELPRYFSSVLFAPEDLALVRGEPGVRRRFLDQLLIQRNPRLSAVIAEYERVLKQRNTLLKSARASRFREDQLGTLDIWDDRLLTLGAELINARLDLMARLSNPLVAAYRSVAGDDHHPRLLPQLTISGAHVEDEDDDSVADMTSAFGDTTDVFRQALAGVRWKELERGLTLVGPHRDDVLFELNGLPAKGYASHGESWSFALALKLASAELLRRESVTGDPVLILDDVFAELDWARRRMLATTVAGYEQVLITAAVYEDVPAELAAHTIRIEAGAIVEPS